MLTHCFRALNQVTLYLLSVGPPSPLRELAPPFNGGMGALVMAAKVLRESGSVDRAAQTALYSDIV